MLGGARESLQFPIGRQARLLRHVLGCSGESIVSDLPTGAMNLQGSGVLGKVYSFRFADRCGEFAMLGGARESLQFPISRQARLFRHVLVCSGEFTISDLLADAVILRRSVR